MNTRTRWIALVLVSGWTGWFLLAALQRWRYARVCVRMLGPWDDCKVNTWRAPLLAAALPVALFAAWWLGRVLAQGLRRKQPRRSD